MISKILPKTSAQSIAAEIDDLIKNRKGRGAGASKPEGMQIQSQIVKKVDDLVDETIVLASNAQQLPPSVIQYGSLTSQGGATMMNASVLSKNTPKGSDVGDYATIWDKANRRQWANVQGHLLNQKLGGPGRSFNLAPITRSANKQHQLQVEDPIKDAVGQDQVVRYRVDVVYGKHPTRTTQQQIADRLAAGSPNEIEDKTKLEIMEHEQNYLPQGFQCEWGILKHANGQWVDDQSKPPVMIDSDLPDEEPQV